MDNRLQTRPFSSRSVERNYFQLRTALPPCKVVHPCRYFEMHNTYMLPALDDHSAQANIRVGEGEPPPRPSHRLGEQRSYYFGRTWQRTV
jgi:hypothetical protein